MRPGTSGAGGPTVTCGEDQLENPITVMVIGFFFYPQVIHRLSTAAKVIHNLYISTGYPQPEVIHSLYISTGYPHVNKLWITLSCVPYSFFPAEPDRQLRRPPPLCSNMSLL
jgi:hypothetical protein